MGKGRITYVGALLDEKLMTAIARWMVRDARVSPFFGELPSDVEVCRRVGSGNEVFILINYARAPRSVALPYAMRDVLAGGSKEGELQLEPYGVAVLERQPSAK